MRAMLGTFLFLSVFLTLAGLLDSAKSHEGYPWDCCSGQDCAPAVYGPVPIKEGRFKGWWEVHTEQARMIFKPDTVLRTFKVNGVPMPGVHACFHQFKSAPMPGYRVGRCLHVGSGT